MSLKTFQDGTVLYSNDLNTNFKHSGTTGTSPISFTPTNATTNVFIIATGDWKDVFPCNNHQTVNLVSDQDGTLYTLSVQSDGSSIGKYPFTLHYFGTLSAATHSLSVTTSQGTLNNVKITVLEFL